MKKLILILFLISTSYVFAQSKLPDCEGSDSTKYNNCFGVWNNFLNGARYIGEFKDGKFHGKGTAFFANGDKYVGEVKDGKQHGQGTYTFAQGGEKKGTFKDGKFIGK
jgi:hypothetical protein